MKPSKVVPTLLMILLTRGIAVGQSSASGLLAQPVVQQRGGGRGDLTNGAAFTPGQTSPASGAWWTNEAFVARLGLTNDQKAKIESAYENHHQELSSNATLLDKEEARLATLLAEDSIDRNAVFSQIDRVIHVRGELERENSVMTLEMRQVLTRTQWTLLAQPSGAGTSNGRTSAVQPQRIGGAIMNSNLIASSKVKPVLPPLAETAGIHGPVIFEAEISKEGIVENLKAIAGDVRLIQAAAAAVKQWRYSPILQNGQPVPVTTTITVTF